ncbi:MAG: acyl carrier protein [Balneola sp.]|nr:MAG: acyl carrier protein [Balneola sp.]
MSIDVEKLIKEVLFLEEGITLTDSMGPNDIDSWDSLGHINIISAIEDEFEIEMDPEEIIEISTIADIKELLNKKLKD